jgi:signal transduction histidine kinase
MIRSKTQNIISLFILLVLLFSLSITYLAYHVNDKKKSIFIQSNLKQIEKSVKIANSIEAKRFKQVLFDYTFWDDMVSFIQSRNLSWGRYNLDPIITTFGADVIWTYDTAGVNTYCKTRDTYTKIKDYQFERYVFDSLINTKIISYYTETPYGILEVFGATIHPSSDPERHTKPRGFFLIGKFIDNDYLLNLSIITGTQIRFTGDTLECFKKEERNEVKINIPITDLNNKVVKYVHIDKPMYFLKQYEKFSLLLIILYFTSIFVILAFLIFIISRWINRPLKIVEKALATDSNQKVEELNKFGWQFIAIGQLISTYISQKKSLEVLKAKAEESDRLKSAFMANMSHELRTPLNGIVGFSELLCKSAPSVDTADSYRKIIRNCSNDLMRLVNDILDYSKIESNQLRLFNDTFSTESIIDDLSKHFNSKAESLTQKGVKLIFKKSRGLEEMYADRCRLKQILTNLISNAIKFTEEGFIEVGYVASDMQLIFYVKDTGIGISEELQHVIFQRFWQAAQPKSKIYGGTGLGLALSKGLVSLMGGNIRVESKIGKGSTFFVELPIDVIQVKKEKTEGWLKQQTTYN